MNKKGFTLIELLVVIAIIGILSSVVLASLNTARGKGSDAAIKEDLNNTRAQAELFYDNNSQSYANVCTDTTTAGIQTALNAAKSAAGVATALNTTIGNAGSAGTVSCHSTAAGWAAEAPLKTTTSAFWCVDSTGKSTSETVSSLGANGITCI
jgi:type IV pilus assembly protein PilA